MNELERQSLTAAWQGPSNVIPMVEQHGIIDVFRHLMSGSPQLEFAHRVAFLRYLVDREALHLSCEAMIADKRFMHLFPRDLVVLACRNMVSATTSPAAPHKAWVMRHAQQAASA